MRKTIRTGLVISTCLLVAGVVWFEMHGQPSASTSEPTATQLFPVISSNPESATNPKALEAVIKNQWVAGVWNLTFLVRCRDANGNLLRMVVRSTLCKPIFQAGKQIGIGNCKSVAPGNIGTFIVILPERAISSTCKLSVIDWAHGTE